MKVVTASKSELAMSGCTHWLSDDAKWDNSTSEAAEFGTRIHKSIETNLRWHRDFDKASIDDYTNYTAPAVEWLVEFAGNVNLYVEVAVLYDSNTKTSTVTYDTGRKIYEGIKAPYPIIAGTADVIFSDHINGKLTIIDWKTGDPFKASTQLSTLAALFYKAWDWIKEVRLISAKVGYGKTYAAMDFTQDASYMSGYLYDMLYRLQYAPGQPYVSSWCSDLYCPNRFSCSAISKEYDKMVDSTEINVTQDNIQQLIPVGRIAEENAQRIRKAVNEYVRSVGAVRLDNGKMYKETFRHMTKFDKDEALEKLRELGATEEDIVKLHYVTDVSAGFRSVKA